MSLGLYVHVPFCVAKCGYCDFVSYPLHNNGVLGYLRGLERETEHYAQQTPMGKHLVKTIFLGGGTPTCLDKEKICHIVHILRKYFIWHQDYEASVEANPGTVDLGKLQALCEAGINRLSIGVQAFQDELLKKLGRIHRMQDIQVSVRTARQAGFENLSLDLMFALPDQTLHQWQDSVRRAVDLGPEHLSCYSLKVEPGTAFARQQEAGALQTLPEELELEMYLWAIDYLSSQGYQQYEISNFSRPGFQCQHNLRYWRCEEYLGLGPAAHSYFDQRRWFNVSTMQEFIQLTEQAGIAQEDEEIIDDQTARLEYLIMGLRLNEGISLEDFSRRFGNSIVHWYGSVIESLISQGLLCMDRGRLALTARALPVANLVLEKFV